jgi:hypothetical protein
LFSPINKYPLFQLISHPLQVIFHSLGTHIISLSSSSDAMEDQIAMALSGNMEEAMNILTAEEAGSSSAP